MTIARALAHSIKLPDRLPLGGSRSAFMGGGGLLGGSAQSGMEAYRSVGAAYGPIRRICESVALTNWTLYQQVEKEGKLDRELLDDATAPARHPATALWTQPNPFMSRRVFLYLQQLWQETAGGCYWLLCQGGAGGSPFLQTGVDAGFELWPIRPDKITPVPDPDQYLAGYVYSNGIEKIPLPVQAIVPVGVPDPLNPLQFAGPLQSIGTDLEAERYASQYNRNVFLNDAQPGGVIEFETPLPQNRFEELVTRWREQHQGLNNAKRVAIIEGGKWVSVNQSNRDMEYIGGRKFSREEVMFALGMPFAMMVTENVNLANATAGEKVFYRWTLRPRLENVKEPLNQRVLPYLGDNLTMDYALPAPEDEAFDIYAGTSGWLAGLLTQNQAREAMGYDSIGPDGDVYVWEVTGTPPPMTPPKPPRRPTNLSHDGESLQDRMELVRRGYRDLVDSRHGR